jgi:hypothetical protein
MEDSRVKMFAQKIVSGETIAEEEWREEVTPNTKRFPYFEQVIPCPYIVRSFTHGLNLADEIVYQQLQGIFIGSDGVSTVLIITLTEDAPPFEDKFAPVLETIINEVGRECGVQPYFQVGTRSPKARTSFESLYSD